MFTPPHYSDLQPIELVWAHMKNTVARQYSYKTTLDDVRFRLNREFEKLLTEEGGELVEKSSTMLML